MSLFGMFKGAGAAELTPRLALASALVYAMGADGDVEAEEIGQIVSVVGSDRALIDTAVKYARQTKFDQFLADAPGRLDPAQRLCILLNVIDLVMADGHAAEQEQKMVVALQGAFGITDQELQPMFAALATKNNRAVLGPR